MSYTVGLDFGTHQTKICIENATNANQKLYEFFEFKDSNGDTTILFPSIVQINLDHTVSYGFVNKDRVKFVPNENNTPLPILKIPPEPKKPTYPPKPDKKRKKVMLSLEEQLQAFVKIQSQKDVESPMDKWNKECEKLNKTYSEKFAVWEKIKLDLEEVNAIEKAKWEQNKFENFHYRYFKLASFSREGRWTYSINSDVISVWYLTYILFLLQEKLGSDFFTQMGVPSGIKEFSNQEKKAHILLVSAYELLEKFNSKAEFLKSKYTDLLNITTLETSFSKDDVFFKYGLKIIPEAYAGLSTLTYQNRLPIGMNLLVDIGGGTTDIAFFTINGQQPDIHTVISIHKGLNYIFEGHLENVNNESVFMLQQKFFDEKASEEFLPTIDLYHKELSKEMGLIISQIYDSFQLLNLNFSNLGIALSDRPIIYCGGGAIYRNMQAPILNFSDRKTIDINILNIPNLLNSGIKNELYPILATAYGLSIPVENEIELTPVKDIFRHLQPNDRATQSDDYIHGLSDI